MEKGPFDNKRPQLAINKLPQANDFRQWPIDVARSKAVEALIQQNDDLMARLSVSHRRISSLEDQTNEYRQEKEKVQFQYDNLKDQVLILKQKAQALAGRRDNTDNVIKALRDKAKQVEEHLKMSEIRYAELYENHEEKQKALLARIDQHARRIRRYLNYRDRVQTASKSLRKSYEEKISDLQHKKSVSESNLSQELREVTEKLNTEHAQVQERLVKEKVDIENQLLERNKILTEQVNTLEKQLNNSESSLKDLREKMAQSTEFIQESTKEHKQALSRMESDHNLHIQKLNNENDNEIKELKLGHKEKQEKYTSKIEQIQRENQALFDKCAELEKVYEENVELQNRVIFVERNRDEQKNKYNDEIEMLQRNLSHYRADSKSKSSELERLKATFNDNELLTKQLKEDKLKLEDQVDATQSLWRETQKDVEILKEKNSSLQKMNQQLSATINQSRKEHRNIKDKFEDLNAKMTHRVKELKRNAETLSSIRDIEVGGPDSEFSPELAGKLETLIAEIQSGFIKK